MALPCVACGTTESKYKCPTCRAPYCSLVCCKKHKETPCEPAPAPVKPQESSASTSAAPATPMDVQEKEDAEHLSNEQMDVLRTAMDVKEMMANPVIMQTLTQIDSSPDKMKTLEKALLDPSFAKFMYQALDVVVPAK